MPSQCRADDGTENVGRYDRGMTEWIPVVGPALTLIGVLVVAVWNGRGESKDIRQLKAMNEVIASLPDGTDATKAFIDARDGMLVRVAGGIASLPRRRRITFTVIGVLLAVGLIGVGVWLIAPLLSPQQGAWLSVASSVLGVIGGVGAVIGTLIAQRRAAKAAQTDVDDLLRAFEEARRNSLIRVRGFEPTAGDDEPGKGRSA